MESIKTLQLTQNSAACTIECEHNGELYSENYIGYGGKALSVQSSSIYIMFYMNM